MTTSLPVFDLLPMVEEVVKSKPQANSCWVPMAAQAEVVNDADMAPKLVPTELVAYALE